MSTPSNRPHLAVSATATLAVVSLVALTTNSDAAEDAAAQTTAVALSSCYSSDNGFPRLDQLTVSPDRVDVRRHAAWVTVTAHPVDAGGPGPATGIHQLEVALTSLYDDLSTPKMRRQPDGTWTGRARIPRGVKPGTYGVDSVRVRDGAEEALGHVRDYYREELVAAGMGGAFQVTSIRDRRAPRLRALQLSSTSVDLTDGAARIRVRARVTDVGAGTRHVSVLTDGDMAVDLRLRQGTRRNGLWAGTLRVASWAQTGDMRLLVVRLRDHPGNERLVYSDKLAARGWPSKITFSGRPDLDDPRLTSLSVKPSTVDLTGGDRTVTATVKVTDRPAGVGDMFFLVQPMLRVDGSRHRGTWRRTVTLDSCVWGTSNVRLELVSFDRAGNRTAVKRPLSVVNRNDIMPPHPRSVSPQEATSTDPVTFVFNEDIVGLSSTSAPVRPTGGAGFGFGVGDPPPSVAGTWSCATSAGAPVDCVAGPLRRATWTPAGPLQIDQNYGVDFNPEHVLDVLDLAGNPIDPLLRYTDESAATWHVAG